MKITLIFISLLAAESNSFPVYPLIAAGSSVVGLVRELISKQTAPALAAPSVGLTDSFSEWKPKLVAGEEIYAKQATSVLKDIYENIGRLNKAVNKISSEVNRSDDIGNK